MRHVMLAALVLAGCSPAVPEGRLACAADADCPPGWVCRAGEQRCYRSGPGDTDAGTTLDGGQGGDAGPCGGACPAGRTCCDDRCVDTETNPAACGPSCQPCGPNEQCTAGRCECQSGFDRCGAAGCEVDLRTSPDHCGTCGMACPSAMPSCVSGECRGCVDPSTDCGVEATDVCASATCDGDACVVTVEPSTCFIEGVCYAEGELNPANPCLRCASASRPRAWSAAAGAICEDGDMCTTGDTCNAAGTCVSGSMRDCSDGNTCTTDGCDPATGCTYVDLPDTSACDDGVFCNGDDTCLGGTCSQHAGSRDCGYLRYCEPGSDACQRCGTNGFICCPPDPGGTPFCEPSGGNACCGDNICRPGC